MKAVLLSIQPKWCELIASEKKTVEVRKTKPKLETPFKVYVYCSDSGKDIFYRSDYSYDDLLYTAKHKKECKKKLAENGHCVYNGRVIGEFVCNEIQDMRDVDQEPTCFARSSAMETIGVRAVAVSGKMIDATA